MSSHYKIIKFQWKVFFVVGLLVVLSTSSVAFIFEGQADIEKKVDALTPQDISALLQKAQSGDVTAQYMIGRVYYLGKGTAKDYTEALKWFRKAAEQGYALAQYSLFGMYGQGEGVPANDKESMKWLRKAAEQAFAPAQNVLGFLYEQGRGVRQDFKEAVIWFRKAAEQGDASAQSNLGTMYNEGRGVGKDFNEAAKWFRMSAEQGWAVGQANLAGIYMSGQGVPRDLVSAYMWCSLAAAAGISECKEGLKALESNMKVEEVAEANRRALAWSQAHPETIKALDQSEGTKTQAQTNPATAETEKIRARAVELATTLENDPLSNKAKEYRKEMKKLMDKKELGVSIIMCMQALGQDLFSKQEYWEELLSQFIYSQVKFSIQRPDKAQDILSMTVVGIEGVLRVYTAIKKVKPSVRFTDLENFLQKQQSGLLEDYIRSRGC